MKSKFKRIGIFFLSVLSSTCLALAIPGCGKKSEESEAPTNVDITKTPIPDDSSLPTAHSGEENLAYIASVLAAQKQYHCYTSTVTNASIATQVTKSYKDYKDGIMISSDITYSSMVKSGTQTCFVLTGDQPEAYMRSSETPNANTTNKNAVWENTAPTHYTLSGYLYTYGLFQTELSNYIINGDTILESSEVAVNTNGTYTQSFVLDPTLSTFYYQYGMKTRGGLGSYPEFQEIKLSVTFDSSWQILSESFREVSKVNKGVIVTSISEATAEYSYDDASFDSEHFAYYNNYFSSYIGSDELTNVDKVEEVETDWSDITNILSHGFSKIMDEGQQFEVSVKLGETTYRGYIFLSLDLADPLNTIALKLSLGKTLGQQDLYVEYKDGAANAYYSDSVALDVNIASLKLYINSIVGWVDNLNDYFASYATTDSAALAVAASDDDSDILSSLLEKFEVKLGTNYAQLILNTDDLLDTWSTSGYKIGVNLKLNFGRSNDDMAFRSASISNITVTTATSDGKEAQPEKINLSLNLNTTTASIIEHQASANADLADYAADVYNLLSSDLINVNFVLDGNSDNVNVEGLKGIYADVNAYVNIYGVTAGADINLSYTRGQSKISASISAYYNYDLSKKNYGDIILTLTSINGVATNVQVCCDIQNLADGIKALIGTAAVQTSSLQVEEESVSTSVVSIINGVLDADFSSLLEGLYADKTTISLNVNVDDLLEMFNIDAKVKFGGCKLKYQLSESAKCGTLSAELPAIGFALSVTGVDGQITKPDTTHCLDLNKALAFVNAALTQVNNINSNSLVSFTIGQGTTVTAGTITFGVSGSGEVIWKDGEQLVALDLILSLGGTGDSDNLAVKLVYNPLADNNSPLVRLVINNVAVDIYADDINGIATSASTILQTAQSGSSTTIGVNDKTKLLEVVLGILSDTDWVETLNKFTASTDGQSFAINYISQNTVGVTLSADGNLSLNLNAHVGDIEAAVNLAVSGDNANLADSINSQIASGNYQLSSSKNGTSFVRVIYDYLFDVYDSLSFANILGEDTYNFAITLNGNNSNISALNGVEVNANLYFSESTETEDRLNELELALNVNGFTLNANIILQGEYIYVSLPKISGVDVPYLKVKSTRDSIYLLAADLAGYAVENGLLSTYGTTAVSTSATKQAEKATIAIEDILVALVNFNLNDAVICNNANGTKSVNIDIDNLLAQLNLNVNKSIGSIYAEVEQGSSNKISASVKNNGKVWLQVNSNVTERKDYSNFDKASYVDLSNVVSVNIADILATLENENFEVDLTLTGGNDVVISQLKNLALSAKLYVGLSGITAGGDITVSYTYDNKQIEVTIGAYYEYSDQNLGNIILTIKEINGAEQLNSKGEYNINLSCGIQELSNGISALLKAAQLEGFENSLQIGTNVDASNLIAGLITANYSSILSGVYSNANGLGAIINADELLSALNISTGYNFGNVKLDYIAGNNGKGGTLSANVQSLGLSLALKGSDYLPEKPTASTLSLEKLLADITSAIENKTVAVSLQLDAANWGIDAIKGLQANLTANVKLNGIAADCTLKVVYQYDGQKLSLVLNVYYQNNKVYLSVTKINGVSANIKVYCDIDELTSAIKQLLSAVGVQSYDGNLTQTLQNLTSNVDAQNIISGLLNANFSEIISGLSADGNGLNVSVNLDNLLPVLGVEFNKQLGNLALSYVTGRVSKVTGSLPSYGIQLSVQSAGQLNLSAPQGNYLNLTQLVTVVNKAYDEVTKIINSQSVYFTMAKGDTTITIDGITAGVYGSGEIVWKTQKQADSEKQTTTVQSVALDLMLSIVENDGEDLMGVQLVYNASAKDDQPLVRIVMNKVGLNIYRSDINSVNSLYKSIYTVVSSALKNSSSSSTNNTTNATNESIANVNNTDGTSLVASSYSLNTNSSKVTKDELVKTIIGMLADTDWVNSLNNMSLTTNGTSVTYRYLADVATGISLTAENGLTLEYNLSYDTYATSAKISVSSNKVNASGNKVSLLTELNKTFDDESNGYKFADSNNGTAFATLVYNYVFDALDTVTVENILGDQTYNVIFKLTGANSNIPALKNVDIDAQLYFSGRQTTTAEDGTSTTSKLTELKLNLDVQGVPVIINVIVDTVNGETTFYLNPAQVMNIKLPDLKVKATKADLYNVINQLVTTLTKTDILSSVLKMVNTSTVATAESVESDGEITEQTKTSIVDIIYSLLTFDLNKAFVYTKSTNNVSTVTMYLDSVVGQLGIDLGVDEGTSLGTVEAVINHGTHAITTSGKNPVIDRNGEEQYVEWISLTSELTARKSYSDFDKTAYVDISFLSTLLSDVTNFATDSNGNMYNMFTFNGTITVNIDVKIYKPEITIDISTLTIGFDNNNQMYVSLIGNLGGDLVKSSTIGFTYHNGYITIAKNLSTSTPLYRIMTIDYFVDHLFDTSDTSPLKWLLGIGDTTWGIVASALKGNVSLSSGIENTQDVYLYNQTTTATDKVVSMYDYINSISVKLNNNYTSGWGSASSIEKQFGISDNYYGFDLKASVVTDGVLTSLLAAITRSEDKGIEKLYAYGAIQSYVKFTVELDYKEGLTADNYYVIGEELTKEKSVSAPSLYTIALDKAKSIENAKTDDTTKIDIDAEFKHTKSGDENTKGEKFGCLNVDASSVSVVYSYPLHSHTVTVVGLDGNETAYEMRHGSTLYLYSNDANSLIYTDNDGNYRLVYSYDSEGNNLAGSGITIEQNTTIYATSRQSVKLNLYNNGEYVETYNTFVGDEMPTTISGKDVVEKFKYADGTLASGKVTLQDNDANLYGVFATSQVEINGVNYMFNSETKEYYVAGKGANFTLYDYYGSQTLIFENEIEGRKVTSIAAAAFKHDNDDENEVNKTIKNVIVPYNITYVGAEAFKDNYGMQSIVFLAENVTLGGTINGDTKTVPFYGNSSEKDGSTTSLKVYYNNIVNTSSSWNVFRSSNSKKIGSNGGALYSAGKWCYVGNVVINNTTNLDGLNDKVSSIGIKSGISNSAFDSSTIQTTLTNWANDNTSVTENCIGKYSFAVTIEKDSFGYTDITINVTQITPKYLLTINMMSTENKLLSDQDVSVTLDGVYETYNGNIYATGDITLTAIGTDNFVFSNWVDGSDTFTDERITVRADDVKTVTAVFKVNKAKVVSKVSFTYGSENYTVTAENNEFDVVISTATPQAEGYVFIRWAKLDNGNLVYTTLDGEADVYYAIWANKTVEIYGVKYEFDSTTSSYTVSGKGTDFDTYGYYSESSTLVLKNEIDGFPVTSIKNEALANNAENNKTAYGIKNIIVPSNITKVGENAFLDNYGIKTIVFLADNVTFVGTISSKTKTVPLYGCSVDDGGTTTYLKIYYKNITLDGSGNWAAFRYKYATTYTVSTKTGGALYGEGTWSYSDITLINLNEADFTHSTLINDFVETQEDTEVSD